MEGTVFMQGLPANELMEAFRAIVKDEISKANAARGKEEEQLLSPAEACKLFIPQISKTTLHAWTVKGLLKSHYIGGRKFYRRTEILSSLKTLKPYSKPVTR